MNLHGFTSKAAMNHHEPSVNDSIMNNQTNINDDDQFINPQLRLMNHHEPSVTRVNDQFTFISRWLTLNETIIWLSVNHQISPSTHHLWSFTNHHWTLNHCNYPAIAPLPKKRVSDRPSHCTSLGFCSSPEVGGTVKSDRKLTTLSLPLLCNNLWSVVNS